MKRTLGRLLVYGGPFPIFLWSTIRTAPAVGIGLSIAGAVVANVIVWKVENWKIWPLQDEVD